MYCGITGWTPENINAHLEAYTCAMEKYHRNMLLQEYNDAEKQIRICIEYCLIKEAYPELKRLLNKTIELQRNFFQNLWYLLNPQVS